MRPDQQFTCISLVATRLLALVQNGHGAPLLVRSCFRGLAIIRFSNSEEIAERELSCCSGLFCAIVFLVLHFAE